MEAKPESKKEEQNNQMEGKIPCPLCHYGLEIKKDKNKKPYCVCSICGIQIFIRGKEGIKRLKEYLDKGISPNLQDFNGLPFSNKPNKAIMILNEMEQLRKKADEVENNECRAPLKICTGIIV